MVTNIRRVPEDGRPCGGLKFYNAVQATVAGELKDLDDTRLVLYDMDTTVLAQLQQNQEQLVVQQAQVQVALEQLADADLTSAQEQTLKGSISGLQQDMTALITDNTTALDLVANSRVLSAESVKQVNEGIGASELTETNYKTVNAIYLSTVAKDVDDFTGQQVQDLFDVANQCPLLGGNAVFQARALYYLINPEQDFDDPTLCLQQGLITKRLRTANINRVSMVPNPASDEAILVLATSLEDGGQLMLYNSVGTSVLNMRIPADQQRTVVSTRTLAPGIYRYRLCSALDDEGEGNLIIAR